MTDATDDFERASLGSNWTQSPSFSNLTITGSSDVTTSGGDGTDSAAFWNANTFVTDQYSQVTVTTLGASGGDESGGGPLVRHAPGASTYYMFFVGAGSAGSNGAIFEVTAGGTAILGASYLSVAVAAGTTYRLTITGTTLTPRVNGIDLATRTDASITSGSPGIHAYDGTSGAAPQFEDWLGGAISGTVHVGEATFSGLGAFPTLSGFGLGPLQPDADSIDGTWTDQAGGTNLFAAIDEISVNDADYIKSATNPVNDICKISLGNPAVTPSQPFIVMYRYEKTGVEQIDLGVRLLQATTEIAAWSHSDISTSFVIAEQTLSGGQFSSISDFNNLFIEFTANQPVLFSLEGDFSGDLTLEGDFSGSLLLEGS